MRESTIVRKIMVAIRKRYPTAYVRKLSDRYTRGLPDILVVAKCADASYQFGGQSFRVCVSAILFVETKTPKGRVDQLQLNEAEEIEEAGGQHLFARDVETVLAKLKEMGAVP